MANYQPKINTKLCQACWKCVSNCRNGVYGKVNLPFHKHAKILNLANCAGCHQCVHGCPHGAIEMAL